MDGLSTVESEVILLTAFIICALIQFLHVLVNRNRWPFVAQNMFAHRYSGFVKRLFVVLFYEDGEETMVLPGRVLPVAFFRAQRMLINMFCHGSSELAAREFSKLLLYRLNYKPWDGFDEIKPSVKPRNGSEYIGFQLCMCELDLRLVVDLASDINIESAIVDREVLCEYISDDYLEVDSSL